MTERWIALAGLLALVLAVGASPARAEQTILEPGSPALDLTSDESRDSAGGQSGNVSIRDNAFAPGTISVKPGTTVVWAHEGNAPHTVTADDGSFDSSPNCQADTGAGCMQNGDTYEQTFPGEGRFPYYCQVHGSPGGGGMAGVVVVEAESIGEGSEEATGEPEPTEELIPERFRQLPATGAAPFALLATAGALTGLGAAMLALRRRPRRRPR